ncbi:ureidoglycolate lyase [Colwellia sp. BRX8-7]|uniref:ureidoglycolate lyase n=1 Tax=Colwellia sp. BRX8-7 TaxID=2759833 RepID=UPI0015F6762E|nr:ureidoglycolate lyase [Colwellia sp. BRX8-7]MBA6337022.1 ureidoglycolate lyase [Colwellia sp. BRX8-7]
MAGNSVSSANLQVFVTHEQQNFNFHAGIWHIPLISEKDRLLSSLIGAVLANIVMNLL